MDIYGLHIPCYVIMFPYYDDCRSVAQDDVVEPHGKLWQGRLRGDGTYIHKQPKRRLLVRGLCGGLPGQRGVMDDHNHNQYENARDKSLRSFISRSKQ